MHLVRLLRPLKRNDASPELRETFARLRTEQFEQRFGHEQLMMRALAIEQQ